MARRLTLVDRRLRQDCSAHRASTRWESWKRSGSDREMWSRTSPKYPDTRRRSPIQKEEFHKCFPQSPIKKFQFSWPTIRLYNRIDRFNVTKYCISSYQSRTFHLQPFGSAHLSASHALPAGLRIEGVARIKKMIGAKIVVGGRSLESAKNRRRIVEEAAPHVQYVVIVEGDAITLYKINDK